MGAMGERAAVRALLGILREGLGDAATVRAVARALAPRLGGCAPPEAAEAAGLLAAALRGYRGDPGVLGPAAVCLALVPAPRGGAAVLALLRGAGPPALAALGRFPESVAVAQGCSALLRRLCARGGPFSGAEGAGGPPSGAEGAGGPPSGAEGAGGPPSGAEGAGGPPSGAEGAGGPPSGAGPFVPIGLAPAELVGGLAAALRAHPGEPLVAAQAARCLADLARSPPFRAPLLREAPLLGRLLEGGAGPPGRDPLLLLAALSGAEALAALCAAPPGAEGGLAPPGPLPGLLAALGARPAAPEEAPAVAALARACARCLALLAALPAFRAPLGEAAPLLRAALARPPGDPALARELEACLAVI
jgi:hypothetical protein